MAVVAASTAVAVEDFTAASVAGVVSAVAMAAAFVAGTEAIAAVTAVGDVAAGVGDAAVGAEAGVTALAWDGEVGAGHTTAITAIPTTIRMTPTIPTIPTTHTIRLIPTTLAIRTVRTIARFQAQVQRPTTRLTRDPGARIHLRTQRRALIRIPRQDIRRSIRHSRL